MNHNQALADLFKAPLDFNQLFSNQRRNLETASEINQTLVESCQAAARCSTEAMRENMEYMMKASKDVFSGGTPEASIAKQAECTKKMFERTLSNLREIGEMVTKSSFEAFDVLNQRCAESLEEISKASNGSAANKKK